MSEDGTPKDPASQVAPGARLLPRITIQAFCEHSQTAQLVDTIVHDRRMSKVALTTHNGGIEAAIETFRANPTPNLVIIEATQSPQDLPTELQRLAEVCDPETRVIVLGHVNDIILYRDLIRFGVSEYLVLPSSASEIVTAIADLYVSDGAPPVGRVIGFVSAKGGAGGSTLTHNVGWAIAQKLRQDVLILDMDLAFGTAGLNFNQDPPHGLADAVFANEGVDAVMLDRLMSKAAAHVNLLTAPGVLDRTYDLGERAYEQVVETAQKAVPIVLLDIPHMWSAWVRHTLLALDEIVIVAEPDLANLRNAKNLADHLKAQRPDEVDPLLVINRSGVPKRPEISPSEFAASVECRLIAQIGFDPAAFGTAANNGQMLAEVSSGHKANEAFKIIAHNVTGRAAPGEGGKLSTSRLPQSLSKLFKIA